MNLPELLESLSKNQVFGGVMGGSLVMSMLYSLKSVPQRVVAFLRWRFMSEVVVHSEDPSFQLIVDWLEELEYAKHARRLRLVHKYASREDGKRSRSRLVPGDGWHVAWVDGWPVVIDRTTPKETGVGIQSSSRIENIALRTPGRSAAWIRALVTRIVATYDSEVANGVMVYSTKYSDWAPTCLKEKRSLASVVLPPEQRDRIVSDLELFLSRRDWYLERGIPYRRGFLFYGPPGTGKTSFVVALASHLGKPIYALNMGSVGYDAQLIDSIAAVPGDAILLIEDIDAAQKNRSAVTLNEALPTTTGSKNDGPGASLSALLNSLDGVFARDGRILIMTTNHRDSVDPAVIRAGRADVQEYFGEISSPEILAMCRQFIGDELRARRFAATMPATIVPSALQQLLLAELGASERQAEAAE